MPPKKLWGGRFKSGTADVVERFTHSLTVDQRLARYDLLGSIAHARMLGKTGVIPKGDSAKLVRTLESLLRDYDKGRFPIDRKVEDIHTVIQAAVERKAGAAAKRLHTARSRNDQVVTALRLYCMESSGELSRSVRRLQRAIVRQADTVVSLVIPGSTHLRHAMPVSAAHHLLAYAEMLERDRSRLCAAGCGADSLPLGSGALAGTSLAIDRAQVARELGFSRIAGNSIDAVSDRDFAVDLLSALALLGVHLSRIAEDLIVWSTSEYGFIQFHEEMLTGSSMMPQKQNPDFLELTRAGAARITGSLNGMLMLLKGLPLGYQRDLQNDKELLFEAVDRVSGMLAVMTRGIGGLRWNRARILSQLKDESLYATDLAEYLVAKGVPFSDAHRTVGKLLSHADKNGGSLRKLALDTFRRFSPAFDERVYELFDPEASVGRKQSFGSTSPAGVRRALRDWKARLRKEA